MYKRQSRVTAATTSSEREKATQWAAAGPSAVSGPYVAASPKAAGRRARSRRAAEVTVSFSPAAGGGNFAGRRLSGSTSARYSPSVPWYTSGTPGIVRWSRAVPSRFARICGASRSRRAATCAPGGPQGPAATKAATASSYGGSCSVQLVNSPASRTCFSSAVRTRSGSAGPSPNTVCQAAHASCASGTPSPVRVTSASTSAHHSGHSVSTASAARTSALRLVSCVDTTTPMAGQSRCTRAQYVWKSSGDTAGLPGLPPTSVADSSGT